MDLTSLEVLETKSASSVICFVSFLPEIFGMNEDVLKELDKPKCGVIIVSILGGMKVFNVAVEALRISYRKMNPFCIPFETKNMGSTMMAMDLGWMGPNYSISTTCAISKFMHHKCCKSYYAG